MEKKFFVGSTDWIIENMDYQITEQDLHKDTRLIVADYIVLTTEEFLEEVKFNYSIEYPKNVEEWASEDNYEYYVNFVQDEIPYDDFAKRSEVNDNFGYTLLKMSNDELKSCNLEQTYIKCAKQVILNNMKKTISELENEIK